MSTNEPPPTLTSLPLLHECDSFYIYCLEEGEKTIRISYIERFPGNISVSPTRESFGDLDERTRRAVIQQVNRRYIGKVVRV